MLAYFYDRGEAADAEGVKSRLASLDRYKLRKKDGESRTFRIMLFPSLNVNDGGGGLKTLLLF